MVSPDFLSECIAVAGAKAKDEAFREAHRPFLRASGEPIPMHSPTHPSPLSEMEATFYYAGLPSGPPLVARTSNTPWEMPSGPEAYRKAKELGGADSHSALKKAWRNNLSHEIGALLDSRKVKWTSIDVVRIGYVEEHPKPVILWIGVLPGSLSGYGGLDVALKCRDILRENDITDLEVEIRESVITDLI